MKNLDTVAKELFNKIRGRYPSITVGDQDATITNRPNDARFFEFDFANGKKVSVNLDEKSLTVMYSDKLFDQQDQSLKQNWFDFLKELRQFAKKRMLNFDTRNITKSNLDKRDYEYLSTEKQMSESKLYGTSRTSFQDIGSAKMIVKHTQPINHEQPAGRTRDIAGIYIESSEGERFKYPYRHLNGARAMARHVAEGGKPYDDFGKYISGLSEELNNLRKFKTYMNRSSVMAEGLAQYMDVVNERIETVKKTAHALQSSSKYKEAFDNFETTVLEEVPEDVSNTWIDELTIKQFNEELKGVFPYIYKLVSEANKIKEIGPDHLAVMPEAMEKDEVMAIMAKHPQDVERMKQAGEINMASGLYTALFRYYQEEMPYGTQKARDGDPHEFIMDRLDDLGLAEDMAQEGKVKGMVMDMEDDAADMSRDDFITKYGKHNVDIWDRVNDEDYVDPSDYAGPEEDFEQHMNSIVDNATYDIEEDPAFEDFKMAAANAAAKGEKEFEYPKGSGKKHPTKMDKGTAAKLLADSQANEDQRTDEVLPALAIPAIGVIARMAIGALGKGLAKKGAKEAIKKGAIQGSKIAGNIAKNTAKTVAKNPGKAAVVGGGAYALDKLDDFKDFIVNSVEDIMKFLPEGAEAIARMAAKYALPASVAVVLAYGGYKLIQKATDDAEETQDEGVKTPGDSHYNKERAMELLKKKGITNPSHGELMAAIAQIEKGEEEKADGPDVVDLSPKGPGDELKQKNEVPLEEFVKSMYDYTQNAFPKGETAVLTAVQKKYGDEAVDEAHSVIKELLAGQDEEMARIQALAGLR